MGEVDRYTSISDSPNSEPGFWEARRPLHSDGGGPHFFPFILHIYTLQDQKKDCGREDGSFPDQECYWIEGCPSPYLQVEGWQRTILNSFHVSCNAYSDCCIVTAYSYCLLCNHSVWLTVIGPLPAKEASLFLTTIPIGMAFFYKYNNRAQKGPATCTEALGFISALLPQPEPLSQYVMLPKGLIPHNLDNTSQYQLSLQSTD